MSIISHGVSLAPVTSCKCLGRVLALEDFDWTVVVCNLRHARQKWAWLTRILSREGKDARNLGQIYLVVVQLFMLYGSESWVLTLFMKRVFGGFHNRVTHRLTGRKKRRGQEGWWVYLTLEEAIEEAGL